MGGTHARCSTPSLNEGAQSSAGEGAWVTLVTPARGPWRTQEKEGERWRRQPASLPHSHAHSKSLPPQHILALPSTPEHLTLLRARSRSHTEQDAALHQLRRRKMGPGWKEQAALTSEGETRPRKPADLCPNQVFKKIKSGKTRNYSVLSTAAGLVIKSTGKSPLENVLSSWVPEHRRCSSQGRVREWKTPANLSPSGQAPCPAAPAGASWRNAKRRDALGRASLDEDSPRSWSCPSQGLRQGRKEEGDQHPSSPGETEAGRSSALTQLAAFSSRQPAVLPKPCQAFIYVPFAALARRGWRKHAHQPGPEVCPSPGAKPAALALVHPMGREQRFPEGLRPHKLIARSPPGSLSPPLPK